MMPPCPSQTLELKAKSISTTIETTACAHEHPSDLYPNISCITANIHANANENIVFGHIKPQFLDKSAMDSMGPCRMWEECKAYDAVHAPDSKLAKVENYLA